MKLADIICEVQNLDEMTQQRLLSFLQTSLEHPLQGNEPLLKEIAERKNEQGFSFPHCQNTNAVRFGKYSVKVGNKTVIRQRYKCKDCSRTFTDLTKTSLNRTRKLDKWIKFIECMI